jgi:hypothetical protein
MRTATFLFFFLSFPLIQIAAQDEPKAPVLVDSFGKIQCEDRRGRLDNFLSEISGNEGHRGVVVVYPSASTPLAAFRTLQDLFAQARFRRFYMDRLDAKIGPISKEQLIEFWTVPPGATEPDLKKAEAASAAAKFTPAKLLWFGDTNSSEESGCVSMPFDLEAYALTLKSLNGVKGKIVVKGSNAAQARKKTTQVLDEMRGFGVETTNIRSVFVKARREVTELWIEPGSAPKRK